MIHVKRGLLCVFGSVLLSALEMPVFALVLLIVGAYALWNGRRCGAI